MSASNPEAVGPELVERMVKFVRGIVQQHRDHSDAGTRFSFVNSHEAHEIVALLPEPVDPDLIEARRIACDKLTDFGASSEHIAAGEINAGRGDGIIIMHAVLAAIKRGRELAAGDHQ